MNEYADAYGQGIFNSVGYEDIFVSQRAIGNLDSFISRVQQVYLSQDLSPIDLNVELYDAKL